MDEDLPTPERRRSTISSQNDSGGVCELFAYTEQSREMSTKDIPETVPRASTLKVIYHAMIDKHNSNE